MDKYIILCLNGNSNSSFFRLLIGFVVLFLANHLNIFEHFRRLNRDSDDMTPFNRNILVAIDDRRSASHLFTHLRTFFLSFIERTDPRSCFKSHLRFSHVCTLKWINFVKKKKTLSIRRGNKDIIWRMHLVIVISVVCVCVVWNSVLSSRYLINDLSYENVHFIFHF